MWWSVKKNPIEIWHNRDWYNKVNKGYMILGDKRGITITCRHILGSDSSDYIPIENIQRIEFGKNRIFYFNRFNKGIGSGR